MIFTVLNKKLGFFYYFNHRSLYKKFLKDKNFVSFAKYPKGESYNSWLKYRVEGFEGIDYFLFYPSTFIANNHFYFTSKVAQPNVLSILEVINSLSLNNKLTYLNFNAGGGATKVMPFYEALKKYKKLRFRKYIQGDFIKPIFALNITTIDAYKFTRARFKFRYDDFIHTNYDVILGSCKLNKIEKYAEKAIKGANKYVIIYAPYTKEIKCNLVFVDEPMAFYIWDISNLGGIKLTRKIKKSRITELDYIDIRRIT